ncbi:MAG TPA: hypothetical protein VJ673_14580 [Aromatoleum sp.]|uniref:hypothetical protein n=1 Tax=Aromatoleum sp. TaxID=2307007 RepID=UPI002B494FBC|nr:hypothetical protein [Aromatoleum sp.]HJV26911.1 hypothetical protein [Aromatoleum sp.]
MDDPKLRLTEHRPEPRDVHPGRILAVAAILAAILILVVALVAGLVRLWQVRELADAGPIVESASPRQRPAPQDDRAAYVAEKEQLLESYGWIDPRAEIARIPVSVAMDIAAARAHDRSAPDERGGRP